MLFLIFSGDWFLNKQSTSCSTSCLSAGFSALRQPPDEDERRRRRSCRCFVCVVAAFSDGLPLHICFLLKPHGGRRRAGGGLIRLSDLPRSDVCFCLQTSVIKGTYLGLEHMSREYGKPGGTIINVSSMAGNMHTHVHTGCGGGVNA